MKYRKNFWFPSLALLCMLTLGGCYTQLMVYQNETPTSGTSARERESDCLDCPDEVPVTVSNRREVCIWQRDIFGFPELRCYNTNYYSSWVYFHNTPWWYRDRFGYYPNYHHPHHRCPSGYYYDRVTGVCRWVGGSGGGGGGGGGGAIKEDLPPRRNARSMPEREVLPAEALPAEVAPESRSIFTGSEVKQLSPVSAPTQPPINQGQGVAPPPPDERKQDEQPKNPPSRRSTRSM